MAISLSPIELIWLWNLLACGRREWLELLTPPISAKMRNTLKSQGLLEESKEKPSEEEFKRIIEETKKEKKIIKTRSRLFLTDKGLKYLEDHLGDPVSLTSKHTGRVFTWVLKCLALGVSKRKSLEELLSLGKFGEAASEIVSYPKGPKLLHNKEELLDRLNSLDRSHFMAGGGLRLKVLRKALPQYPREVLDNLLLELQKEGKLVLYRFDDPLRVDSDDQEAAIKRAGIVRHYLFLNKRK